MLKQITETADNTPRSNEKAIIKILCDYVVFQRIGDVVYKLHNVGSPENGDCPNWLAYDHYNGFIIALDLMEITDGKLRDKLADMCLDICCSNLSSKASKVAESIYIDWLVEIKNNYIKVTA